MRLRITFSKQGALRYTGHLDLHKIWERSLRRARLPLAYSQGFHPQPRIQLAAALPLGFASRAEVMDIWLTGDLAPASLPAALEGHMPPGLAVLDVEQVDERAPALQTEVVGAEYRVEITGAGSASGLTERLASVLEAESILRERRGKPYDLRPLIEELALTGSSIFMHLSAREGATGRPEEVLAALGVPLEATRIERTRLLFRLPGAGK
ncbi:MAG: TIGR03936 family radical SAM-associated protein [Chloroflexota bacterium]